MSEFFRKNWWAWFLIIVIIIVILAVIRLMGGSTWADWFGLQLLQWNIFWGQRPFSYENIGLVASAGVMIVLIIIVIIVIFFLRRTFFKKE